MSTENKTQASKSFFVYKILIYGCLGACISWLSLMIVFGNFIEINEDLYARTFMVWRSKGGDASMFEGRYKGYKLNDYEENKDFTEFCNFAHFVDGYLIAGNYPLHAPREPEHFHTLIDEKKVAYDFWEVEFNIKALLNGQKTEDEKIAFREKAIQSMKNKKYELNFKKKWFVEDEKITSSEIANAFKKVKNSVWWDAAPEFLTILKKLADNKDDYKFTNGEVSDNLFQDIKTLLSKLNYNADDLKDKINMFFKNMGTVKASPFETFVYSRFFNLYTFLTINHPFDYKKEISKNDEKKKDELHSKEKAEIFAHIFSNVYTKPFTFEIKNPTMKERFMKMFGPSQDISKITEDQSENIKNSIRTIERNLPSK